MNAHAAKIEPLARIAPIAVRPWQWGASLALVMIGLVTFWVTLGQDPSRAWHNYLLNYYYWLCIALGGAFFLAIQYLTGSVWSVGLRRVGEAAACFLPVVLLIGVGLLLGGRHLFDWADPAALVGNDPHGIIRKKLSYLNWGFFSTRQLVSLTVWTLGALYLVRNSIWQDHARDARFTKRNTIAAAAFVLFFAISFTLATFDLLMSLQPTWFSTMMGVYGFAGLFQSSIAMMTVIAVPLYWRGAFGPYVRARDHLFDFGKWLFAFTIFWAYIAFSQYMLIWYADLPEETTFFLARMVGDWRSVSWTLIFAHFVIPFVLLLPQDLKRMPGFLLPMALWLLGCEYLDLYWIIFPHYSAGVPVFGFTEIGIFAGFAGLFMAVVLAFFSRTNPVPIGDPHLREALEFHQA